MSTTNSTETLESVDRELHEINTRIDELKEKARHLRKHRDLIAARAAATAKLDAMSPAERVALVEAAQSIGAAGGVKSAEKHGTIGGK